MITHRCFETICIEKPKPAHLQISEAVRNLILGGKLAPGERIPSTHELAKLWRAHVPAVHAALTTLVKEDLLVRVPGSGTFVTDHAGQRFVALAALFSEAIHDSDYQARVFRLVDSILRERGFQTCHYVKPNYSEAWADFRKDIASGRLSGAAFFAMWARELGDALQQKGIPFIGPHEQPINFVYVDYETMARDGARYLVERGCRKIAFMGGDLPASFRAVLGEAGVPIHEPWLRSAVSPHVPGAGWEQFRELWAARDEKPDGLLVLDDVLFRDVALGILNSHIRVPDQLQVVTHSNKGSGLAYPFPVALLEIDPREVAEATVEMLMQLMRKETVREPVRSIQARLIPASAPQPAELKL